MSRDSILHMFSSAANLSPFDVNMAIDAGWQHCIPYTGLQTEQVADLTQDAIFSRGPKGVRRTGIFVGGRDIHVASDMLQGARKAMVPPFEVSVFADPSGAFTTAAAMVACVEREFAKLSDNNLEGKTALVFGGTGPVGMTCAMLATQAGAHAVIISHQDLASAQAAAAACQQHHGYGIAAADGSDDAKVRTLLATADVVFSAAKAGVQVLSAEQLSAASQAKVFCDVNAVPPEGIAGVGVMDHGVVMRGTPAEAVGIGALAVGNVKYKTQQALLQQMLESESVVGLGFADAFRVARGKV